MPTPIRRKPIVSVNFGGGVNSTGLLVDAYRRELRPDIIVFADTGSEMPHTYEHLDAMQRWLKWADFPAIDVVRWIRKRDSRTNPDTRPAGSFVTIEEQCLTANPPEMPSKAYGLSGCTNKWKQQPADEHVTDHPLVAAEHAAGRPVERWIGFDADEPERFERMMEKAAAQLRDGKNVLRRPGADERAIRPMWTWRAPLVEWGMGRDECIAVIQATDGPDGIGKSLTAPRKSACFFCPSSKKKDVLYLRDNHPELLLRALAIEDAALPHFTSTRLKGLGRSTFNWRAFLETTPGGVMMKADRIGEEAVKDAVADVAFARSRGLPIIYDLPDDDATDSGGDTACGCYDGD